MLEGNGNIHFLITMVFGSKIFFFETIPDTDLEKTYITVGSLAINVKLLRSFKSRLEVYVLNISRNKEMWSIYLYKLLIILLKDLLSNIERYRRNSLYIDHEINDRLLSDALCCLKALNNEYNQPIPNRVVTLHYSPIYFWVDWFFCVYIAIFYICGTFFRVLQVIQTFCICSFFYYVLYYVYLIFLGWLYSVVFLLVTM